jgi:23S rRNA (cytosine1962-C5)-methyltransferase
MSYELLDFGGGRKLERFGPWVLDRPCPAAEHVAVAAGPLWNAAQARYHRSTARGGRWERCAELPEAWQVQHDGLELELRLTPSGQVGLFPEHVLSCRWLSGSIAGLNQQGTAGAGKLRILHLFAYTGAATLAAAAAGAEVTHVDASRSVVRWARCNAQRCGLQQAPVRWIVDDVRSFVGRELRRRRRYDGLVADPPSYGHGPRGDAWQIDRHLPGLLRDCAALLDGGPHLLLLTCHTPGYDAARLAELCRETGLLPRQAAAEQIALQLPRRDGRVLACGHAVRYCRAGEAAQRVSRRRR